jgi:hypothetical protein
MTADRWEFYLTAPDAWRWRRTEAATHLVVNSDRCYHRRDDCVADAMRHGYMEHAALLCAEVTPVPVAGAAS